MAQIYSYPTVAPLTSDLIIGSRPDLLNDTQVTYNFQVGAISTLVANSGISEITVSVTNAQWLALQTSDVTLLPSPGAGLFIKVISASILFDFTVNNFTFASPLVISAGQAQFSVAQAASPVSFDSVYTLAPTEALINANAPLLLTTAGAIGQTAQGTVKVKLRYQILSQAIF